MIALDAGVLIGLFDASHAHHSAAETLIEDHLDEELTIGPLNLAEVLVGAVRDGREDDMLADLRALAVRVTPLPDDAPARLARLRAATRAKMPDCCVLLTAEQTNARVATFDAALRDAARSRGFATV